MPVFSEKDACGGLFRAPRVGFNLGECVSPLAKTGVWRCSAIQWPVEQVLSRFTAAQAHTAAERAVCSLSPPAALVGPEDEQAGSVG